MDYMKVDLLGKQIEGDLRDRTGMDFRCFSYADMSEVGLLVFCGCTVIHKASFPTKDDFEQFSRKTVIETEIAVDNFLMSGSDLAA